MSNTVIKVENLSKKYIISHKQQERYTTLRDVIAKNYKSIVKRIFDHSSKEFLNLNSSKEDFLALKNVSFEVNRGDRIGIIGRNGAGKSTLLKILSRITEPTTGRIEIKGRVASLLEVGTGFHPELTGRENIYLDGAILGMTKNEIKKKFDDIVTFAEIEKFLDTPVKRYSSGMYVRLAFAVAAHLEPEILVVDEVLSVGDVQFQKKCLGKMEEVGRNEGRTILFVSHDMSSIKALCNKVLRLDNGSVVGYGNTDEQITNYLTSSNTDICNTINRKNINLGPDIVLDSFSFLPNPVVSGNQTFIHINLRSNKQINLHAITIVIYTMLGFRVSIIDFRKEDGPYKLSNESSLTINGEIDNMPLIEGNYRISLYYEYGEIRQEFMDVLNIRVESKPLRKGYIPYSPGVSGIIELNTKFTYQQQGG
ncbi:ABC transporter ATP-binding protein [Candidatus Desantisbacteria bacterium]|nr:ABC transporter ATP-binding protein [Candidatus Desantisbacteria bacterium]